jgi:hypothetical protein
MPHIIDIYLLILGEFHQYRPVKPSFVVEYQNALSPSRGGGHIVGSLDYTVIRYLLQEPPNGNI